MLVGHQVRVAALLDGNDVYAVVIYSRAAAERLAVPVAEIALRIAPRHGLELIP